MYVGRLEGRCGVEVPNDGCGQRDNPLCLTNVEVYSSLK